MSSYPYTVINTLVALGVLVLHWSSDAANQSKQTLLAPYPLNDWVSKLDYDWAPPFRAWTSAVVFFFAANVFLAIVPLVPPLPGQGAYENLPYWVCLHLFVYPCPRKKLISGSTVT